MLKLLLSAVSLGLVLSNAVFAKTISNINYAGDNLTEHTLNIYTPDGTGPYPVVINYGGQAFMWMDSKSDGGQASSYNAAGFIVVGANLSGGGSGAHCAHYPTQIQELKATVRFLRANAEKYNIDPTFIGVMGFSSGAWNTVILSTTGDVDSCTSGSVTMQLEGTLGGNLEYSSRVQAGWASAPPTDFSVMNKCGSSMDHNGTSSPEGGIIGGQIDQNPDKVKLANPITFISKDDPPIHLVHGTSDDIVPTCQSEMMWEALQKSGNEKDNSYNPVGGGHAGHFDGSLDFFKKAFAANKEGCLDTASKSFDPMATYCLTGECCDPIVAIKSVSKSTVAKPASFVKGLDLVNTRTEAVTYTVFDVAGHVVTSGTLASNRSFNLTKTGSGLRLCQLSANGVTMHETVICP